MLRVNSLASHKQWEVPTLALLALCTEEQLQNAALLFFFTVTAFFHHYRDLEWYFVKILHRARVISVMIMVIFFKASVLLLNFSALICHKASVNSCQSKTRVAFIFVCCQPMHPVGSGMISQMSSAVRDVCSEVMRVNLPKEIQSPYFILRPLCVAK